MAVAVDVRMQRRYLHEYDLQIEVCEIIHKRMHLTDDKKKSMH